MIEGLIKKYGEKYRHLIVDALVFLDAQEPQWHLDKPIDREAFIDSLLSRAK